MSVKRKVTVPLGKELTHSPRREDVTEAAGPFPLLSRHQGLDPRADAPVAPIGGEQGPESS